MALKDLIHIPETVHNSDFVVSLADGIDDPARVVDNYVVTDQLIGCFRSALDLILSTVESGSSKGAYLHGSFGSGKSHFMAILHLLLQGNAQARSKPELAPVVEMLDERLGGRKFLLVPYHMVGAASMEAGVLGGYVDHVRKLHPEAPTPAVYLDAQILEDARNLREKLGDEAFFATLGGGGDDDGFGDLAGGWDAQRFEAALAAPSQSAERRALVSDYIDAFATAVRSNATATGAGFVPFDEGLNRISEHARGLGYDGLVLFLDELILWFASRMQDPSFVAQEGQKIAKLVEASSQDRPAPIASLIARQRDLRDFLGSGVPGADKLNFGDNLQFWESRFDTIKLSDTNLRAIVEKRLLKPKDAAAKTRLDEAFNQVAQGAGSALETLMTSDGDRAAFRSVYPFSPATIDTLVAVSAYLQRERTALRLLAQLLAQKGPDLDVGDLVPLGDLYDVIRDGEEPFSDHLRQHFQSARTLYDTKLRPILEEEFGLGEGGLDEAPANHPARMGDRIMKTLVLASLVPDAGPLRGLTVRRIADLNHGSIRTPIRGQEASTVLSMVRKWAPEVPELQISDDGPDPVVSLQLTGVDVSAILSQYQHVDNSGARRAKVRELVYQALEVSDEPSLLAVERKVVWRGSRRSVDIRFGNVRDAAELLDSHFRAEPGRPRIIIDFPFDDPPHLPSDDLARIRELRESMEATPTVAWLPRFLTEEAQNRLGRLVVLDHLLSGDRLQAATRDLSAQDRQQAENLLRNQQTAQRSQMRLILQQAYGVDTSDSQWVVDDLAAEDQFSALDPTLDVRPPTKPSMADAFEEIVGQVLSHEYPAHPQFESHVTRGDLMKCLAQVERAVANPSERAENIPGPDRAAIRKVLQPLEVAITGESHIQLKREWRDRFHARMQQNPGQPVTVERLRAWIDSPEPRGLEPDVESLVILSWALQTNRTPIRAGLPIEMKIGRLEPDVELRPEALPDAAEWAAAGPRIEAIFGVAVSPLLNASNMARALKGVREQAHAYGEAVRRLAELLPPRISALGLSTNDRLATAKAVAELVAAVQATSDDVEIVRRLAALAPPTSEQAMGRSLKSAGQVADTLADPTAWRLFSNLDRLEDARKADARRILETVSDAVARDELAVAMAPVVRKAALDAADLLTPAPPPPPPPPDPLPPSGTATGDEAKRVLRTLASRLDRVRELEVRWKLDDA